MGIGVNLKGGLTLDQNTNYNHNLNRSESFSKGNGKNTNKSIKVALTGYKKEIGDEHYYGMGNTGFALVKSKTADVFLLKLEHNNAVISTIWVPNEDIPEDVNIIPFPMNPLYVKQGTLDGKFGAGFDDLYRNNTRKERSYYKPKEAYRLKHRIEKEQMRLEQLYQQFDVQDTNDDYIKAATATGLVQLLGAAANVSHMALLNIANQAMAALSHSVYNDMNLRKELAKVMSKKNIVNTYIWTIDGGFYAESTQMLENTQEVFNNSCDFTFGGGIGYSLEMEAPLTLNHNFSVSNNHSLVVTRTKTKEYNSSWQVNVNVNVNLPTSPRKEREGLQFTKNLIDPGTVDAYRFMTFYLEQSPENYDDLFNKVIDQTWLNNNPNDPYARALLQAKNSEKRPHCWRIMHRVTYVSRILPGTAPLKSLEYKMKVKDIESNYLLIKLLEPHVDTKSKDEATFEREVSRAIRNHLPEFVEFTIEITVYMKNYYGIIENDIY